jgi:hypothetical protein
MRPLNQLLSLLVIIVFWKNTGSPRLYFVVSFLLYAAIVVLSLGYFGSRDPILFT